MALDQTIQKRLDSHRSRLNKESLAQTCALSLVTLLSTLVITVIVAAHTGAYSAVWAIVCTVVGAAVQTYVIHHFWLLPKRGRVSDVSMARWYEQQTGSSSAEVITAIQTAYQDMSRYHSPALREEVVARSQLRLEEQSEANLHTHSRTIWFTILGGSSLLASLTLGLAFPGLVSQAYTNLFETSHVERAESIHVVELDQVVEDLAVEIQMPEYTGGSRRELLGSEGRIQALTGSTALMVGRSSVPARSVVLLLESDPEGRWPVLLGANGIVRASMRIGASDRYRFAVTAEDGQVYLESTWRDVVADADQVPMVRLIKPTTDIQVHPADQISVSVEVTDDFGIAVVDLVVDLPGGTEFRQTFETGTGLGEVKAATVLSVDALKLTPGAVATVSVEAKDSNNVSHGRSGRSKTFRLLMANPDAEHEELMVDLEKWLESLIDLLADRLESPVETAENVSLGKVVTWHERIVEAQSALLLRLETVSAGLTRAIPGKDEASQLLRSSIAYLETNLSAEKRQLEKIRARDYASPRPSVQAALLRSINSDGVVEIEKIIFQLKDWLDRSRQERVMERGREMLSLQNELHDLLTRLKETGDPSLTDDALQRLGQLEHHLQKVEEQLGRLAERVPYENQNAPTKPSDNALDMQSMRNRISEAKRLLAEGKVSEAMKLLEKLNTDTQQMMARLSNEFGSGKPWSAKGERELSKVQSALRSLQGGQESLNDETDAAFDKDRADALDTFREQLNSLGERAKALREHVGSIEREALHPSDLQGLSALDSKAKQLMKELEDVDLDVAKRMANDVENGSQTLREEIGRSEEREVEFGRQSALRDAMSKLKTGSEQARELAQDIDALKEKLARRGSSGMQQQPFKRLGRQQGRLERDAEKLRKALRQLDSEVPGIKKHLDPDLEAAQEAMEDALGQLNKGRSDARGHQRDALERLGKALKGLEEKLNRDSRSESQSGPNDSREKVAIPDADAYEVPKEFREELLRAMKERAPKKFDKENRRFYEELVK